MSEYFPANQECRVLCEGAYNYDGYNYMEYSADLFQTITGTTSHTFVCGGGGCDCVCVCVLDHYMQVLSCKQRCAVELASNTDQPFDDFLPSHFNYLQFSYYNRKTQAASDHPGGGGQSGISSLLPHQERTTSRPSSAPRPSCCSIPTTR